MAGRYADRVSELVERVDALADAELVELVIGVDRADAVELLAGRGLRGALALTCAEASDAGLTPLQAARLRALSSTVSRAMVEPLTRGARLGGGADVFRHYHASMRELRHEQFRVLMLDGKHRVLREELISQGTLTSSPIHPREVFAPAIRHSAAALVMVHNHPSGDPTPSADDLEVTRRLCEVGLLVGIRVVDHVIVGDGQYCSMADRGLLR